VSQLPTADELETWAVQTIVQDLRGIIPKIKEYGAVDLELMGKALLEYGPPGQGKGENWLDISVGMEHAVIFYLMGKIGRCVSAIAAGEKPSDDTYMDITIYSLMLRYIRVHGVWGLVPDPPSRETEGDDDGSS
jgi:hypothetical protein